MKGKNDRAFRRKCRRNIYDIRVGKDGLSTIQIRLSTKEKNDKLHYIKIKKPVLQKEKKFILKRMKKQTIEWKKYITIHLWTKDLPKYVKTSPNQEKDRIPIGKWTKYLNKLSQKMK